MDDLKIKQKKREYAKAYYWRKKNGEKANNAGRPANTPDVLWSKVDKRSENECWEWKGYKNADGYGKTWINDRGYFAHRVIFDLAFPNIITLNAPKSTNKFGFVLHTCDNPICCNPKHLWVGTHKDNMEDKKRKGRCPDYSGDKGPRAKLTMAQARQARELRKNGAKVSDLAKQFELSLPSMKTLLCGQSYKETEVI